MRRQYLNLLTFYFNSQKQHQNQGFALFIVMTLGTVGIIAASSLLMRTTTVTNANTKILSESNQNLGIAEAAKTRIQALLIENSELLDHTELEWEEYLKSPNSSQESRDFNHSLRLCRQQVDWTNKKQQILKLAQHKTVDLPMGKFSLESFEKKTEEQLIATIKTKNIRDSFSQYQLNIKLFDNYLLTSVPVLWLTGKENQQGIQDAQVDGNLWANNCRFPLDDVNLVDADSHQAQYTGVKLPELPDLEMVKQRLPEDHYIKSEDEEKVSLTLPRPEDQGRKTNNQKTIYEYLINDIDTIDSLTINSSSPDASAVVILYIVGDINISEIIHKCESSSTCSPENLIIVGYEGSKMCLQLDHLDAFIVAPNYQLGIKSVDSTTEPAQFTGSIWIDNLSTEGRCGNDQIEFHEALQWSDLPSQFQSIDPIPKTIEVNLQEQQTNEQ